METLEKDPAPTNEKTEEESETDKEIQEESLEEHEEGESEQSGDEQESEEESRSDEQEFEEAQQELEETQESIRKLDTLADDSSETAQMLTDLQKRKSELQDKVDQLSGNLEEAREMTRSERNEQRREKLAEDDEKAFSQAEERMTPNDIIQENIQLQKTEALIQEHAQHLESELSGLDEMQEEYQTLREEIDEGDQQLEELQERRKELWDTREHARLQEQEAIPLIQRDKKLQAQEAQENAYHELGRVNRQIRELWQSLEEKRHRVLEIREQTKDKLENVENINAEIDTILERIQQEDRQALSEAFESHYEQGLSYQEFAKEYNTALVHAITPREEDEAEKTFDTEASNRVGRSLSSRDKVRMAMFGPAVSASSYDEYIPGETPQKQSRQFFGESPVGVIYGKEATVYTASPGDAGTFAQGFEDRGEAPSGENAYETLNDRVERAITKRREGHNEFVVNGQPAGVWVNLDRLMEVSSKEDGEFETQEEKEFERIKPEENLKQVNKMKTVVETAREYDLPVYASNNGKIYKVEEFRTPQEVADMKNNGELSMTELEKSRSEPIFPDDDGKLRTSDIEDIQKECFVLAEEAMEPGEMADIESPMKDPEKRKEIAEDVMAEGLLDGEDSQWTPPPSARGEYNA